MDKEFLCPLPPSGINVNAFLARTKRRREREGERKKKGKEKGKVLSTVL